MKAVIKLHLKENIKKGSFIIYGVLGTLITLFLLFQLKFSSTVGSPTSDYAIYGVQWTILSVIASLAGVSFSMNIIGNHRVGTKRELLQLHGLPIYKQYLSLFLGNVIVTSLMALILCMGMFSQIIIKGLDVNFIGLVMAVLFYLLGTATVTIFVSLLSLLLPSALATLFGVFITIVGSIKGLLLIMLGNRGGLFGKVMGAFLKLAPPLDEFAEITRDVFLNEFIDYNKLFSSLLYLWFLIGVVFLITKVVAANEG